MSDLATRRRVVLINIFDAFNRHDAAGIMACMTDDVVFDTAAGPDPWGRRISGAEHVAAAFERVWTEMPDVSWTCTRHSVLEERGVSEWMFRGTLADGTRVEAEGCDLFVFSDEKIAHKSAFRKDRPLQVVLAKRSEADL